MPVPQSGWQEDCEIVACLLPRTQCMLLIRNYRVLLACDADEKEKAAAGLGTDDQIRISLRLATAE